MSGRGLCFRGYGYEPSSRAICVERIILQMVCYVGHSFSAVSIVTPVWLSSCSRDVRIVACSGVCQVGVLGERVDKGKLKACDDGLECSDTNASKGLL